MTQTTYKGYQIVCHLGKFREPNYIVINDAAGEQVHTFTCGEGWLQDACDWIDARLASMEETKIMGAM